MIRANPLDDNPGGNSVWVYATLLTEPTTSSDDVDDCLYENENDSGRLSEVHRLQEIKNIVERANPGFGLIVTTPPAGGELIVTVVSVNVDFVVSKVG